jgi:putative membrane protein
MHVGNHYSLPDVVRWTRRDVYLLFAISAVPTVLYAGLGQRWLALPWVPVGLLGTAVAFVTGFKNNAAYNRVWEARQIWGGIVNASRTFAMMVRDMPTGDAHQLAADRAAFGRRHIAWLTALRYQLREPRGWEHMSLPHNAEYRSTWFTVAELAGDADAQLARSLSPAEMGRLAGITNRAAFLLGMHSEHLAALAARGALTEQRHVALAKVVAELVDQQGRAERIKNFPYPRQFATVNLVFMRLFIVAVPLGLLPELAKFGDAHAWLTIPVATLLTWVFHTLERVGESAENPFEGGSNDVPITQLARAIEIDVRQLLDLGDVPPPLAPVHQILM